MPYQSLELTGDGSIADRNFGNLKRDMNPPVPQARVFNSANISIVGATQTLTFDSEHFDNGGLHSTSANTSRLTAPITGLYAIGANVEFASNATGIRGVQIRDKNAVLIADDIRPAVTGAVTVIPVSTVWQAVAGDWFDVVALQTSGGALNVDFAASYSPEFWMYRVAGYVNEGV